MKIKKKPQDIFAEYQSGKDYNSGIGLYKTVAKNRDFFHGDQWKGVNAPNLAKPVFNVIKRSISYFIAMIVSDDVGVHISPFDETEQNQAVADILANSVEKVLERTRTNTKARMNIQNCCVDGDTAVYINFDPEIETNQTAQGDIDTEIIDNTNIIFGNPYSSDVQKQPYILVVQRLYTAQVKDMAKEYGLSDEEISNIVPDEDDEAVNANAENQLTTVITKFWKEKQEEEVPDPEIHGMKVTKSKRVVHMTKVTKQVTLKEDTNTEYKYYPIAYMSWEKMNQSYHGRSPVTGLIPNQVFINKIYAMCMVYSTNMGFPQIFYDQNKIAKLTNDVSQANAITNMDMAGRIIDAVKAPDFSNQIIQLIDSTIDHTKDFMGASDAALGNITNPNNTSAIVAVQQASSAPLEIQKLDYYQFYEDIVRIIIDIMSCDYGKRQVKVTESQAKALGLIGGMELDPLTGQPKPVYKTYTTIDYSVLKNMNYDLNVAIGQSSYWSEATQVQTMDNLFDRQVITNPVTYLEGIPDKYIKNKQKIIDELKQQRQQLEELQQAQAVMESQAMGMPMTGERPEEMLDHRASNAIEDNEQVQEMYDAAKEIQREM